MEVSTWTDHGATGVSSKNGDTFNAIDANVVRAGNGWVMNFGSFWGDIHQVPLTGDDLKQAPGIPYKQIAFQPAGTQEQEGSHIYERQGMFYLFWSEGICCVFDKTKPAPGGRVQDPPRTSRGPYVDREAKSCAAGGGTNVVEGHGFVYGPGGQGVFSGRTHGTVLYYHYVWLEDT
ncbi:endo-alpha-1-5-arabinanase precursor [Apiospora saccharicola]|uniref:Endo-1,5-alpha-L-arabinanase A n=1 Tax=Apiospora saccharicola TaxID=335842 RepID=A0ABR1TMR4_9PEZI